MMGSSCWWRRRLVLLILLCVSLQLPVSRGCFPEERAALMKINTSLVKANSFQGPPWDYAGDDCCSWERVTCSNATRRVSRLNLSGVYGTNDSRAWNLDTTVFAAFPELQFLDLSFNRPMDLLSFEGLKNLSNLRELDLRYNSISGNVPSFLFSLPHIEALNLSDNMFEGPIPISSSPNLSLSLMSLTLAQNNLSGRFSFLLLNNLSNLKEIDLSWNPNLRVIVNILGWVPLFQLKHLRLSGCDLDKGIIAKPTFLGTQHYLETLALNGNNLSGDIPNWLFTKGSTLVTLDLGNNYLTGSVDPIWRYPQQSLQEIIISMNLIVGQLPANISLVFPNLTYLDVSNNNLSGEIPMSLCHINHIEILELSGNKFFGEIPACVFTDLPNLSTLAVSNNRLSGQILGGRNNLSISLTDMYLDGNKFEGALPRNLLGGLYVMDLHDNRLTGELDTVSWNISNLQILDVSGNYMTGEIQPQICALASITVLDLSNNHFTGRIRGCDSPWLMSLNVSMNSLSGDVSWDGFNSSNLFDLDFRNNMLTGNLGWVHHLQGVRLLFLDHNEFHGQIPPALCELRHLRIINLSHNKLSGLVPLCIGALFSQDSSLFYKSGTWIFIVEWYAKGRFSFNTKGMQLTYGTNIDLMSGIDLSSNLLSGEIPWELGELNHVKFLNLSRNAFVGRIPASLANMSDVESLDLSHNMLTGVIPPELTQLQSLEVFSVAYNHLSGCVPSSDQFSTFDASSYEGNNLLEMRCSSSPAGLQPGPVPPQDEVVVDAGPYAVASASVVLAFWATVAFVFCHSIGRRMVLKL